MKKELYLVTGAAGHLGNTIVSQLTEAGKSVRALVLPFDKAAEKLPEGVEIFCGDVRNKQSMLPFFAADGDTRVTVIHAAGIVSIASRYNKNVHDVNVDGTRNVVELCEENRVAKLVYISSVHAIPELPKGQTMTEIKTFSPDIVSGLYAKTKAEATAIVLDAAQRGLDASVVHPSGIAGPNDFGRGHITQLLIDYCNHKLTAGVSGGYDFVDVRDVAAGVIACCEKGKRGECYILSNRYISLAEVFECFHEVTGLKRIKTILPMWFAKGTAALAEAYYKIRRKPPLFTAYSLATLSGNALFSNAKAARELGYKTRPFRQTVADAYEWLKGQKRV